MASLDELDDDLSFDVVPKKMELDDRVLGEGDGGLIVHHQSWPTSFLAG